MEVRAAFRGLDAEERGEAARRELAGGEGVDDDLVGEKRLDLGVGEDFDVVLAHREEAARLDAVVAERQAVDRLDGRVPAGRVDREGVVDGVAAEARPRTDDDAGDPLPPDAGDEVVDRVVEAAVVVEAGLVAALRAGVDGLLEFARPELAALEAGEHGRGEVRVEERGRLAHVVLREGVGLVDDVRDAV